MKVFTVGLDQKPPVVEKSESPPPGYVSTTATPLPMGPEIAPIIVRKSRGYKGILMVMLAVFLMAIFALTLSEIAYNRQRDENFFRLQWAQLKHRLGYEYPHRIIPVNRGNVDFGEVASLTQQKPEPMEAVNSTPESPPKIFIESSSSRESSSTSASSEQPNFSENFVRDARLQFLRQILQRIKQNAEQMGFDGTMQVSVIEVDPQQIGEFGKKPPSEDPRSDAFLDSFGEFHAPPPFGVNGPPPMREINENSIIGPPQSQQNGRWPAEYSTFEIPMTPFQQQMNFRSEPMSFRLPEWSFQSQQQRPEEWSRHPFTGEIPKEGGSEFGASPSQEVMGEIYGRKFGRILQDLIAARIQNSFMQQQQQQPVASQMMMQNLVMPMRSSFPIEMQQPQQSQTNWWSEPQPNAVQPQQAATAQIPQVPSAAVPEQKPQEPAPVNQQPTSQQQPQVADQFGQGFPQPQFPVFVSPEDRIQIEPPNGGASWQPPQQPTNDDKQQMPPHAILDFMPPRGWTHQSESAPAPPPAPLIDNEILQQSIQQPVDDSQAVKEPRENRIVILKKPVDGEKHEEFGASQLSDLPLKELQGQLAAAAAALTAQQHQDTLQEKQKRFDEEVKAKNLDLQRPQQQSQESDLFKSIEQNASPREMQASQEPPQVPLMVEIADEPMPKQQQQPVEPAPIASEHNAEETSEQVVDFPAVKFPNQPQQSQHSSNLMNDMPEQQQNGGIFFQVDEPHQSQHNVAGFA